MVTVAFIIYLGITLLSYTILPKNRKDKAVGVLFIIDTHNNVEEYDSLRQKICEQFELLAGKNVQHEKITPVILSFKQVEAYKKKIGTKDLKAKLIDKCNCLFGIFIRANDDGKRGCNNYQLQMQATFLHPHLNRELKNIFQNNFNYIFRDLRINSLDRNQDLGELQSFGSKLFYICRLVFAVANAYSGYLEFALKSYCNILSEMERINNKFYSELTRILHYEICGCAIILFDKQYQLFIEKGLYDGPLMNEALNRFYASMKKTQNESLFIRYNLQKAIHALLAERNILEAKGSISILQKRFKKVKPNLRPWTYSEAFLFACAADTSQLKSIRKHYSRLKHNKVQDAKQIYDFINSYIDNIDSKLSIKLALFWLVFYREDLSKELIPGTFMKSIIDELTIMGDRALLDEINQAFQILSQR